MKRLLTGILAIGIGAPIMAQNGIKDAMVKHWQRTSELTIAVADAMPAEHYGFRPNPAEMSFGQLMAHIGAANLSACAAVRGEKPEFTGRIAAWVKDQQKVEVDKETAVAFLKDSLSSCQKTVAAATAESLQEMVGSGARAQTRFELLWGYFTHTAHHRGQAEVYLRLKDIKPPKYVF